MNDRPLTIRVLAAIAEVPASAWNALVTPDSSPFVEHEWLDVLEQTGCVGGVTGWTPMHFTVWRGDSLAAAAPAYMKEHSEGEFVFDWSWAEAAERAGTTYYPKLVFAVPFTPATGDRVLVAPGEDRSRLVPVLADAARHLCTQLRAGGVHVLFPREDEAAQWESAGYLRREGIQFHWSRLGARAFDDYLDRFTSKQRNQIRRELRRIDEAGVAIETLSPEAHTAEVASAMYRFYASTIAKHGRWGRLYLNERFFQQVVGRFRHRLAWVVARGAGPKPGSQLLGGAFNVVKDGRLYGRYWGATNDVPFLHFAVCYYAGIRYCIEHGIDAFEPGAGGEHKRPRGFFPTLTCSAHWVSNDRLRRALKDWLCRERAHVRAIVAGESSQARARAAESRAEPAAS